MPPKYVKTIREKLFYEYAKLISRSAFNGQLQYGFITNKFKELKSYYAFRKIRNFVSVEIHPHNDTILIYLTLDPNTKKLENGFTRDVSNIGHLGAGNLEIILKNSDDFNRAKTLITKSYESN